MPSNLVLSVLIGAAISGTFHDVIDSAEAILHTLKMKRSTYPGPYVRNAPSGKQGGPEWQVDRFNSMISKSRISVNDRDTDRGYAITGGAGTVG